MIILFMDLLKKSTEVPSTFKTFSCAEDIEGYDILFSVGGDGTFLESCTLASENGIPIMGINTGTLGFLSNVGTDSIDDAIDAIITWLKNTKAGIFNIGGADTPTNLELISLINKKMSKKVQPIFVNQEQHDFIADISNMKKILKFTPRIKIKDGINKTIEKF